LNDLDGLQKVRELALCHEHPIDDHCWETISSFCLDFQEQLSRDRKQAIRLPQIKNLDLYVILKLALQK
jgi:hypothetical protein